MKLLFMPFVHSCSFWLIQCCSNGSISLPEALNVNKLIHSHSIFHSVFSEKGFLIDFRSFFVYMLLKKSESICVRSLNLFFRIRLLFYRFFDVVSTKRFYGKGCNEMWWFPQFNKIISNWRWWIDAFHYVKGKYHYYTYSVFSLKL